MFEKAKKKLAIFIENVRIAGLAKFQPGGVMARRVNKQVVIEEAGREFNRNFIIPDSAFLYTPPGFDVQKFLKKRGSVLAKKKFGGRWASDIIDDASQFVSARTIITKLEKEYRLIRGSAWEIAQNSKSFPWAMGYSCDDAGRRNPDVRGFENQVMQGSANLKSRFDNDAAEFVGKDISKSFIKRYAQVRDGIVIPQNKATVVLYIYTPYIGEWDRVVNGSLYKKPFANYYFWLLWDIFFGVK